MKRRMHRLVRDDGRILIVAMDHTSFMDVAPEGLVRYGETCRAVVPAGADAFLSPIGYQTNTLVYSVGGYKFTDYLRLGTPLNTLCAIIAVIMITIALYLAFAKLG